MHIPKFLLFFLCLSARLFAEYDPIAVYLTWQRAPHTTMTVQWITGLERTSNLVEYQRVGESLWKKNEGKHYPMPGNSPYLIHRSELSGLEPDSDYRFRTGQDGVIYKFRTMPSSLSTPIRFIVGGDIYHDKIEILEKMNRQAARQDPMFVLLGGDLAYNESRHGKPARWLDLLISWKKQMVTSAGRLIPLIPAIGNHELEKNHGCDPASAPFFYAFFPMGGYGVLDFGKYLSVILLDSDHTHPIEGAQTEWLSKTLSERENVPHKIALYHVPAYPSVRDYHHKHSEKVRKNWVPLFEKMGLTVAFENHDHAYKRTWPLRNGKHDKDGVLYLGDGGWAVEKPRIPKHLSHKEYLAKTASSRNFVLVILHGNDRHFIAIDENGLILDETVSKVKEVCTLPTSPALQ